jgi:hypothetical protein
MADTGTTKVIQSKSERRRRTVAIRVARPLGMLTFIPVASEAAASRRALWCSRSKVRTRVPSARARAAATAPTP